MPVKSGFDHLKEVKPIDPASTFIAITGDSNYSELLKTIESGFDDYLKKPINFDVLADIMAFHRKKIMRWLSR